MARFWQRFAGTAPQAPEKKKAERRASDNDPGSTMQEWQNRAWGYFNVLGEIHYGSGFYARMLAGVRIYVEELTAEAPTAGEDDGPGDEVDDTVREWKESNSPELNAVLTDLENTRGGLSQLQAEFGRLWFVQGESLLTCTLEAVAPIDNRHIDQEIGSDGIAFVECWEMLSGSELIYSKTNREYTRRSKPGKTPEKYPETDPDDPKAGTMTAYRFYHRDPQYSGMADSSIRAILDDCEELLLLKQSIRNTARSRTAGNGVLFLPAAMAGEMVDRGDGHMIPKNAKDIYDAINAPIVNEQAASAVSPIIMFTPDGVNQQNAFHLDLRGAALYKETGLRDEVIRRIAIGLDMPPEALLGTASANHWTAWQIDDSAWTAHGLPVCTEMCGQLTAALLAPVARAIGKDPRACRIWFDATEVVQDPDRARAAAEAFDRKAISYAAYRRETGWDEEDAPDDAELEARRAADQKDPAATTEKQKAEPQQGQASAERIVGMAEGCVLRCRELAGSRMRSKLQASVPANLAVRMRGSTNADLAHRLGTEVRDSCDPDALVAGAGSVFLGGLERLGMEPSLSETLVRRVEEHAALTLFDADPFPLPDEVLLLCGLTSMRI